MPNLLLYKYLLSVYSKYNLHGIYNGVLLFSTYPLQPSRLIVRSGLDVPTIATRGLHAAREHAAAEGGTVGEKCPNILPKCRLERYS